MNRSAPLILRIGATAAAGAAVLLSAPGTASATEPTTGAAVGPGGAEKSIVLIGVEWTGYVEYPTADGGWAWSDPVSTSSTCTGWFASDEGHIVTAGHCVDPEEVKASIVRQFLADAGASELEQEAMSWRVEGFEPGSQPDRESVRVVQPSAVEDAVIQSPLTVQVLDWQAHQDGDLALLKANGLSEPTPPLAVAAGAAAVGDEVTSIGFPGNVMSVSDGARLRASFKTGTVSSAQVSEAGVSWTEISADVSGGMSGGPTVDADGSVLGVNSFGFDNQSFNFITDGEALGGYLAQHGVETTTPENAGDAVPVGAGQRPTTDPAPVSPVGSELAWPSLAAGGAAVLALAGGGAFLVTRRRSATLPASRQVAYAEAPGAVGPVRSGATRVMDRSQMAGPPCSHPHSPAGSRFCLDCGSRLSV